MSKETKSTSKNTRRRLAWYLIPPMVIYLLFTFIAADFNSGKWGEGLRIGYAFFAFIYLCIAFMVIEMDINDHNFYNNLKP